MRRFWDRRAGENPWFFVDDRVDYRNPDTDEFWRGGADAVARLLEVLGVELSPQDTVVEIGCGIGRLTRPLARRAGRVLALDVSARMLELAREHNAELDNVSWLLGDGFSLKGVQDASADACLSWVVFQHIPDPAVTLGYVREIGRVLRPGGWAAFQLSNDASVHEPRAAPERLRRGLLAALGRAPKGQADPAWLGSAVELDKLEHVAGEAGMKLERVIGAGTQFCVVLARRTRA